MTSTTITEQWAEALRELEVRHPDRRSTPVVRVCGGVLQVSVAGAHDTVDDAKVHDPLAISSVTLTFFPGAELARMWFTAAWVNYLQHEALELVTWRGVRPLDPHEGSCATNPQNRCLRDGFPVQLTPGTMFKTFCLVMSDADAGDLLLQHQICEGWP